MANTIKLDSKSTILIEGTGIEIKNSTTENSGVIISINGLEIILIEKENSIHSIRVWDDKPENEDYAYKQIIK